MTLSGAAVSFPIQSNHAQRFGLRHAVPGTVGEGSNRVSANSEQSMHVEAVAHARLAERSAEFAWEHLRAEYTQDIEKVLATLATEEPLTWTLPEMVVRRRVDDLPRGHRPSTRSARSTEACGRSWRSTAGTR